MISLLYDTTIGGVRFGKGSLVDLDPTLENQLIATGNATRAISFSSTGLLPERVAQSFATVTRSSDNATDTNFVVLASPTVPGGTMRENSKLVIISDWDYTNSPSVKTIAMDWGGSNVSGANFTTTGSIKLFIEIMNANSLSEQKIMNASTYASAGGGAHLSSAKDTSGAVAIDFKVKWGANVASESITLLGYSIWHYPAP